MGELKKNIYIRSYKKNIYIHIDFGQYRLVFILLSISSRFILREHICFSKNITEVLESAISKRGCLY